MSWGWIITTIAFIVGALSGVVLTLTAVLFAKKDAEEEELREGQAVHCDDGYFDDGHSGYS